MHSSHKNTCRISNKSLNYSAPNARFVLICIQYDLATTLAASLYNVFNYIKLVGQHFKCCPITVLER